MCHFFVRWLKEYDAGAGGCDALEKTHPQEEGKEEHYARQQLRYCRKQPALRFEALGGLTNNVKTSISTGFSSSSRNQRGRKTITAVFFVESSFLHVSRARLSI